MHPIISVVLAFASAAIVWTLVLELLSRAGGWKRVARRYKATKRPPGRTFRMQSCSFGWVDYIGTRTIVVSAEGIYLGLWPILRLSHPALLIPWSALHVGSSNPTGLFKRVKVAIDQPALATLRLPYKVVEAAAELVPASSVDATGDSKQ